MKRFLDLHLTQAEKALRRSSDNHYSDRFKQEYHEKLVDLCVKIRSAFSKLGEHTEQRRIFELKVETDFIFKSLEFLDGSTLNVIPFEIVECLKCALFDWVKPANYIIVTSLVNDIEQFCYDHSVAFDDQLFAGLKHKYQINFDRRLIQINLPKSLSRDFLACVVLYHELGHFVDLKNSCSVALAQDFYQKISSDRKFKKGVTPYFPIIHHQYKINKNDKQQVIELHFGEYFCDLFASQYVGDSLNHYLYFLTQGDSHFGYTHPSTINRISLVKDFLEDKSNPLLDFIKHGIKEMMKPNSLELEVRFERILSDDFYNFLPIEIQNISQLHGLFKFGWETWRDKWDSFETNMGITTPITSSQVYPIINNLMEKSIGNFIVTQQWKEAHSKQIQT
jgi:hypothetical protein